MTALYLSRVPPSLHRLYGQSGARKFKSKEYASWLKMSKAEVMIQRPGSFTGCNDIMIRLPRGEVRASSDADNRCKGILDLLVCMHVIPDDKQKHVRKVSAEWADIPQTEIVITEIMAAEEAA